MPNNGDPEAARPGPRSKGPRAKRAGAWRISRPWSWAIGAALVLGLAAGGAVLLSEGIIWHIWPNKRIYGVAGMDISNHQGEIRWEQIDESCRFAFIKASEGDDFVDKSFQRNVAGARSRGILVGAYHFYHFSYDGRSQAKNFIQVVQGGIDLPPVVDLEYPGRPEAAAVAELRVQLGLMLQDLEAYYKVKPIIYTTLASYRDIVQGQFSNPLWIRSVALPYNGRIPEVLFWQYHDRAHVKGITGRVDLDVFRGSEAELRALVIQRADKGG